MTVEIKVPRLAESISEATLVEWLKGDGTAVRTDEPIATLETDKAAVEIVADTAGVLAHERKPGDVVKVGDVLGRITEGTAPATAPAAAAPVSAPASVAASPAPVAVASTAPAEPRAAAAPAAPGPAAPPALSPAVRRIVEERGLDPAAIPGTGPGGRILKDDAQRFVPVAAAPAAGEPEPASEAGLPAPPPDADEQVVPMSRIRLRIAERLVQAQHTAAILTTFNEVDMSRVMEVRARHKEAFEKAHSVKLGYMSFFARACVLAFADVPAVNAEIRGTDLVYHRAVHLGIAASTERGLVVPVVRDAHRLDFAGLERDIARMAQRARDGQLTPQELSGGTFTITNGGVFGSLLSTPILNPPQSGILGMHKIEKRPIALGDDVVVRPMMYVALSYDHRVIDGRQAVTFLVKVKERLEDPERMLLAVYGGCRVGPETFDLVVIGSGPGGYVAAIRAAQLGLKTACIEKYPTLGGTCLNVGCIPSKALLDSSEHFEVAGHGLAAHGVRVEGVVLDLATMQARKSRVVQDLVRGVAGLFRKHRIERITGTGRLVSGREVEVTGDGAARRVTAQRILIATGSKPAALPNVAYDGRRIVHSTDALTLSEVPPRLLVVGAGAIGLELGSVWRRLGSRVTVLEYLDRIVPGSDAGSARLLQRSLERQGMQFRFGVSARAARVEGNEVRVEVAPVAGGEAGTETADVLLVAVGRRPFTDGLGARELGVRLDARGRIEVDAHFQTSVPGVYAIGDVIAGPMLAHKAEEEGIACVERMAGGAGHVNYAAIPNVVYTWPEFASVGLSEEDAKSQGVNVKLGTFPFLANPRAKAMGEKDGQVKILADAATDRVLGAHIVGPQASTLISELVVAMEMGASAEDLARSVHAHPTLPEAVKEAALGVAGRALHI